MRCPECSGEMLWDRLRRVFYCDECWTEIRPEEERYESA